MAFIPAPNVALVTMKFLTDNQEAVNSFHFKFASTINNAQLQAIAQAMYNNFWSSLKTSLCDKCELSQIKAVDLSVQNGGEFILNYGVGVEKGSVVGPAAANNAALVVTNQTVQRGKSYRGRQYLGGLCMYRFANSITVLTGQITEMTVAFGKLLVAANTAGAAWVVLSRYFAKAPRPTAVSTPITSFRIDNAIDSQRRRLYGRGI